MTTRRSRASAAHAPVRYRIVPIDPKAHLFEVTLDVIDADPSGQRLALPAWIPGSYMIREFARHIVSIEARVGGRRVAIAKRDKHTWQVKPSTGALTVRYRVYAWDWSVRAAHLDETHGFFNGTSVFLCALGHEDEAHDVDLVRPAGRAFAGWRVATTLPELGAPRHGFGTYRAPNYDALVDHPVEMGTFRLERFAAAGVPHEIAYSGTIPNLDAARINADVAKLCAAQIAFFKGPREPAPFDRYVFLTAVAGEGYGGLEHRSSTALLCTRDALPVDGDARGGDRSPGYLTFLGLVSHEYFHSWNVKRMKPAAFAPYDLTRENYTSLLWIFEGFTSYYDDLFLARTRLATEKQYLAMLAKTIDDVLASPGRRTQTVGESSFDAWIKYYRQDENTPNAVVSYYRKGSLVALCLDLLIRAQTRGRASLDDAMRLMWRRYGRDFYPEGRGGLGEDEFADLVAEATGVDVKNPIARWAYGTDELPIAELARPFGLVLQRDADRGPPIMEARLVMAGADTRIASVTLGGAAHAAGLSAGDALVAIDGLRIQPGKFAALTGRYRAGDAVDVTFFRQDVLMQRRVTLAAPPGTTSLTVAPRPRAAARSLLNGWLATTRR
jgi:predicted metalloprotease with PDZ domain